MKLSGADLQIFHDALCGAYTRDGLKQLLRFKLDINYDGVIESESFHNEVFDLLRFFELRGQLFDFIQHARQGNPTNVEFGRVSEILQRKLQEKPSGLEKNTPSQSAPFATLVPDSPLVQSTKWSVPPALQSDPNCVIMRGRFPESLSDSRTAGHQCIQLVLAILSDRGANLVGNDEITRLAKGGSDSRLMPLLPHLDLQPHVPVLTEFEMAYALKDSKCNVSAENFRIPWTEEGQRKWMPEKIIDCYVMAGYPSIIIVDPSVYYEAPRLENGGHPLVIVGFRWWPSGASATRTTHYVVHDPWAGSFQLVTRDRLFKAACAYGKRIPTRGGHLVENGRIHIIYVAEAAIKRGAMACYDDVASDRKFPWREGTFRMMHLHKSDVSRVCGIQGLVSDRLQIRAVSDRISSALSRMPCMHVWAIEAYSGSGLQTLHLCNAEIDDHLGWEERIIFADGIVTREDLNDSTTSNS